MEEDLAPLRSEDCANAAHLHKMVFSKGWEEEVFQDLLQAPSTSGLKFQEKGSLLGFIIWREVADEAEVITFVIHPDYQRKGKGTLLLFKLYECLITKGILHLFLEVAEDNLAGISFYKTQGFIFLSKRPAYYQREKNKSVSALNFFKKLV